MEDKQIILVGDTHGEWQSLFKKIEDNKISDCIMIQVGDLGAGFNKGYERDFIKYNEFFKKKNIYFYALHGNHDNPAYFDGSINFTHFKLLKDYTELKVNDELWQFVGGAISVDRKYRVEGRDYWRDEKFILNKGKAVKCDVLVCHTAPTWIGPACKGGLVQPFLDKDFHLYDELIQERKNVQELFDICRPKKAFFGHFHRSEYNEYHGDGYTCKGRIIDILEFIEYRK